MITIDLLPERERQRLYMVAAIEGYRLMQVRRLTHDPGQPRISAGHYIARLGQMTPQGRCKPIKVSRTYETKKEARRALLQLMLDNSRRSAA